MPEPLPRPLSLPEQLLRELEASTLPPRAETAGSTIKLPNSGAANRTGSSERPNPKPLREPAPDAEGKSAGSSVPAVFLRPGTLDVTDAIRQYRRQARTRLLSLTAAALAGGFLVGWWYHPGRPSHGQPAGLNAVPPTPAEQAALDAAFAELKAGRFAEARVSFGNLARSKPKWPALQTEIASALLYDPAATGFKPFVADGEANGTLPVAQARFLLGQWCLSSQDYEDADRCLGESAGADPTRADTYLFWGDCLLRWGRPADAVEKYRAAQLRNPYASLEGLYVTKLWLAEVASGLEASDGSGAKIDAALAAPHPTSAARFAAAARALKAGQFGQTAALLAQAQQTADPAVFRLVLFDPYFQEESWRPELAPFYGKAPSAPPAAVPSPKQP